MMVLFNGTFLFVMEWLHRKESATFQYNTKIKNRQQELDLQVKSRQIETIAFNLPFPLCLMDKDGKIVLHNQRFLQFVISNETPLEYNSESYHPEIGKFIKDAYVREEAQTKTFNYNGTDIQALSIPVFEDRKAGWLFMFLDITKILEGERLQKRFLADASHELKTPLSVIMGMIEILNRPNFKDEEIMKDFLNQIEVESQRMDNILSDLLSISKISANKVVLYLEPINLKELIEEVYTPLKLALREKNLSFTMEIDETIVLNLDHQKAYQIFSNLLINAIKFTEEGSISIKARISNPYCIIEVQDTGVGIKEDDQKYLFERFFRADNSRARTSGGSGLGLAIVKSSVIAHKGEIEVSSVYEKGSLFTVKLPL